LLIKSLHTEFDDEDDPQLRRIRRECERRVKECEERLQQSQSDMRRQLEMQAVLFEKAKKDRDDARGEADDAQRGGIIIFNEQKRYKSHIQPLQNEVH
jgi:hypothetical protein